MFANTAPLFFLRLEVLFAFTICTCTVRVCTHRLPYQYCIRANFPLLCVSILFQLDSFVLLIKWLCDKITLLTVRFWLLLFACNFELARQEWEVNKSPYCLVFRWVYCNTKPKSKQEQQELCVSRKSESKMEEKKEKISISLREIELAIPYRIPVVMWIKLSLKNRITSWNLFMLRMKSILKLEWKKKKTDRI